VLRKIQAWIDENLVGSGVSRAGDASAFVHVYLREGSYFVEHLDRTRVVDAG
jgi:hypothetical protein